ncbi:hypothetical protein EDB92DRAFT_404544 [Lactarius akahatsu]|uniref:C2 domain-containing protein n=1 Tax=Lactarius akahatsu TaxID=416441 RepID=A0AAD4LM40_9AGAM|nr:hypothetical protein EDB92DRAFT_404544 [Lactarius akahatsu]
MAAEQDLEHGQMSSRSLGPSPSRNLGRGCVNPLSCLPILCHEQPLDSPRDAEPQGGPSQLRVDVTVLRADNVPRLKNVFGLKFFVTVASQAIEKKTPSVPAKRRTARWGESPWCIHSTTVYTSYTAPLCGTVRTSRYPDWNARYDTCRIPNRVESR